MAGLLVKFREAFPGVTLNLKDYDSTVLIDGLLKGAFEVAITSVPEGGDDGLHAIKDADGLPVRARRLGAGNDPRRRRLGSLPRILDHSGRPARAPPD
jgi:hypothetical protein